MFGFTFDSLLVIACLCQNVAFVQCRSTIEISKYSESSGQQITRCLKSCADVYVATMSNVEISRHQTCYEKCLGRNKEGDFNLNARIMRIPPHLTPSLKRRKRNANEDEIACPYPAIGNNSFPTLRTPERSQYENSDKWYLNISWHPISDSTNFTGYGISYWCDDGRGSFGGGTFAWLGLQKNETYVIFNESESCWNYNMTLAFRVIVLPCLNGEFKFKDLPWNIATTTDPVPTANKVLSTDPVPTTNKVLSTDPVLTTNKLLSTVVPLTVIAITVVLVSVISATYLCLRKRKRGSHNVPTDDADYDAFIIFNQHDQKWVDEVLLQILEKESHYKCCVHYRDFTIGKDFVTNMTDSVQNSRKVIAVISKTFFSSKWCNFELQQAIYKHIKKGDDGVIVIKIDNVSTKKFPKAIQTKSFIDYSNRVERPFFKTRLLRVLGPTSNDEHTIPMQIDG